MKPEAVTTKTPGRHGKLVEDYEPQGGIFAPLPARKLTRVAYTSGPKDGEQQHLWQCPVSAIPQEAFELLMAWWDLRMLRLPPPVLTPLVRRSFSVFEGQMRNIEAGRNSPQAAAAMAVGSMMKLMHGGGR